ncbi:MULTISPECIES: trypsin-like serine peptidase [unclassified Brevundimonas]|uniref:trypsin-like serine peptidase n=1 Tax=unclassified Brevundimonas TaxID=2622653 RepID=UPI0025BB181E|nr:MULTISPECIES: serine protease [unclassified Brevundimonas]
MVIDAYPPEPPVAQSPAAVEWDMTLGLINATIQIDQSQGNGRRKVGTGVLINAPRIDGTPRILLVTADHVFAVMPHQKARFGWRNAEADGNWRYAPAEVDIRSEAGDPLWTKHPEQDVAVMEITAPEAFARAAIPVGWLADSHTFDQWRMGPGDELFALGYPHGLSANRAGFPILRSGRISSWPLTPIQHFPTFLLDFNVSQGNSGGPVFWVPAATRRPGVPVPDHPFIAGLLIKEVQGEGEGIELGVVAHAQYIHETIALLDSAAQGVPQP